MPNTRDLAKATLDRWIRHLENPEKLKGKTATETEARKALAKELLAMMPVFRKAGRPPYWWATEAKRLETMGDVRRAWEEELEKKGESRTAWKDGKYPSSRRAAYLLRAKYPEKYPGYSDTLARQFQYYFRKRLRFAQRKI